MATRMWHVAAITLACCAVEVSCTPRSNVTDENSKQSAEDHALAEDGSAQSPQASAQKGASDGSGTIHAGGSQHSSPGAPQKYRIALLSNRMYRFIELKYVFRKQELFVQEATFPDYDRRLWYYIKTLPQKDIDRFQECMRQPVLPEGHVFTGDPDPMFKIFLIGEATQTPEKLMFEDGDMVLVRFCQYIEQTYVRDEFETKVVPPWVAAEPGVVRLLALDWIRQKGPLGPE